MKAQDIKARWQVDDGYGGKSRPQSTYLDIEDFSPFDFNTWEEAETELYHIVYKDFDQKITFHIQNLDEIKSEWERFKKENQ